MGNAARAKDKFPLGQVNDDRTAIGKIAAAKKTVGIADQSVTKVF
jgi:hypothetical protein